jgi:hypothetical protein
MRLTEAILVAIGKHNSKTIPWAVGTDHLREERHCFVRAPLVPNGPLILQFEGGGPNDSLRAIPFTPTFEDLFSAEWKVLKLHTSPLAGVPAIDDLTQILGAEIGNTDIGAESTSAA